MAANPEAQNGGLTELKKKKKTSRGFKHAGVCNLKKANDDRFVAYFFRYSDENSLVAIQQSPP